MVVDYSKWDKLELSDDSDIEVHPNVDKKSFIRWKQRDIHEKRQQEKLRMLQLEVNIETNEDLLLRVRKLIQAAKNGRKVGLDVEDDVRFTQQNETKLKPAKATSPDQPMYPDMIESMLLQIVGENSAVDSVLSKLVEHESMIANALDAERTELAKIHAEREKHITADDIRTGWDSTIVYKNLDAKKSSETPEETSETENCKTNETGKANEIAKSSGNKTQQIETLNSSKSVPQPKIDENGLEELLVATREFGEIPIKEFDTAFKFLMQHPYIVTENQKDALMMSAFEHELAGHTNVTKRVVWNALLLQYCFVLGKDGVRLFFSRVVQPNHAARQAFEEDAKKTYDHICNRCKIISAEREAAEKDEGTIQLQTVDPNTEILIAVPSADDPGRLIYDTFDDNVKKAIESKELDEINAILASLSVEDAEELVGKLGESGVLKVDSKIYEPQEWDAKVQELQQSPEEAHLSSVDEVD